MPRFLLLIYGDERTWAEATQEWRDQNPARHRAFLDRAGPAVLGGEELQAVTRAANVRLGAPGQQVVTDGPFAESKEVLGGYYLVEATDLEAAIALARLVPEASDPRSGVEVRPIAEAR
jgi:hypothetical protein